MKPIILYLLQACGASGILYGYYHLFLKNKKFHQYNRFYLLFAIILSLTVPFLNIPVYFESGNSVPVSIMKTWYNITDLSASETTVSPVIIHESRSPLITLDTLIYGLYALVILILLLKMIFSLKKITGIIKNNPVEKLEKINLVETHHPDAPFSFFRWLFWHKEIEWNSAKGDQVFRHEFFHIQQKHSLDLLFLEIINIIFWINPFFHLMRREVKAIHEFLADSFAATEENKWDYTELLLMRVLQTKNNLINPFFHNQIKRRIAMITNAKTTRHQYLRKLLVLPVITMVIFLFAFKIKDIANLSTNNFATNDQQPVTHQKTLIEQQDTAKSFFEKAWRIELSTNEFIIEKPGYDSSTHNIIPDLVILNGANYSNADFMKKINNARAIKATKIKVIPPNNTGAIKKYGAIANNGVIEFSGAKLVMKTETEKTIAKLAHQDPQYPPLIVIDGKVMEQDYFKRLNDIDPNTVESVTILKDGSATTRYGEKGKYGVIEITMKKVIEIQEKTEIIKEDVQVFTKMEIEPAFPGGAQAWSQYLKENMDMSIPSKNGAEPGKYTVFLEFVVYENGSIRDIKPLTNHGFGMEAEAIRLIKNSPKWLPGIQNGHKINGIKKLPFNFTVPGKNTTVIQLPQVVFIAYTDTKLNSEKLKTVPVKPVQTLAVGSPEWKKYLERSINSLIALDEGWKPGDYEILIQFNKKPDGTISEIKVLTLQNSKTATHCANVIEQICNLKAEQDETVYIQPLIFSLIESKSSIVKRD